ncbi:membrane protein, partial [Candidatus Magnetomorum sp. HK-1]
GQYFFNKLDDIQNNIADNMDSKLIHGTLEIFYILICLGFRGIHQGNMLHTYKNNCYEILFNKPYHQKEIKRINKPLKNHIFLKEKIGQLISYSPWIVGLFSAIKIYHFFLSNLTI